MRPLILHSSGYTTGPNSQDHEGTDPMATVSVKKDEGRYWPAIWVIATIICVIVAIILIVF